MYDRNRCLNCKKIVEKKKYGYCLMCLEELSARKIISEKRKGGTHKFKRNMIVWTILLSILGWYFLIEILDFKKNNTDLHRRIRRLETICEQR